MSPKIIFLPLRIGLAATRLSLSLSTKVATRVAGEVIHVAQSRFGSSAPESTAPAAAEPEAPADSVPGPELVDPPVPPPAPSAEEIHEADVVAAVEIVAPLEQPDTPLTFEDAVVKTVDDADEVVAEFAEPGAEDGAGAQIQFDEPWEGYDGATAEAITAQLASADAAVLAVVELYESTHRARQSVLDAAAARLEELSAG